MAQDLVPKRRMLAAQLVTGCEQLAANIANMSKLKSTLTQTGGGFEDTDFETGMVISGVNLSHLQSYEPNVWLNICVTSLMAWLDAPIEEGSEMTNRMIMDTITGKIV